MERTSDSIAIINKFRPKEAASVEVASLLKQKAKAEEESHICPIGFVFDRGDKKCIPRDLIHGTIKNT